MSGVGYAVFHEGRFGTRRDGVYHLCAPPRGGVALRCGVRVPVGYSPITFPIASPISFSLRIHKKWKGDSREVGRGGGVNSEGVQLVNKREERGFPKTKIRGGIEI